MTEFVTVKYSCKGCGLDKVECKVRARRKKEDITVWVKHICMGTVAHNHRLRSPACFSQTCDLMIPVPKDNDPDPWIGKAIKE